MLHGSTYSASTNYHKPEQDPPRPTPQAESKDCSSVQLCPQFSLSKMSFLHPKVVTLLCACTIAKEKEETKNYKTGALPTNKEEQHLVKAVK